MTYISNLHRMIKEGYFIVTAEIGPPKGADPNKINEKAYLLKGHADAYNLTDNQTAVVRMSSIASSVLLINKGMEPIMQITCRDRNRIALQSDILGASALGIRNILCLTGDHQSFGNHPHTKGVFDIDAIQLIKIARDMRDKGLFENGEEIKNGKPLIIIGAASNPFIDPLEMSIAQLEKKIDAGAEFIQTQSVFNIERFNVWIDSIRSLGLDKKIPIIAGVTPLKSLKMTERMKYHVPGADVPDEIEDRMKKTVDQKKEGYDIALETIKKLQKTNGIRGIHITALFWEEIIPSLVKESGLYPRP
ncbi:MAG: methylenetetrahydrofolate reductase [Candidatus Thermoplasmatota archaeon]